jgi:hypothetical protein
MPQAIMENLPIDNSSPLIEWDGRLRLAIISTPRSGNSWLRRLLGGAYGLVEIGVHAPDEVPWDTLPERCVLQLHWPREDTFVAQLEQHEFQVVVIARHPLDILISLLNYLNTFPVDKDVWRNQASLRGDGGDERGLLGATPRSAAFLDYARGPRAQKLLAVTRAWWQAPGAKRVRYEDLVAEPRRTFRQLIYDIGYNPRRAPVEVIADNTVDRLRSSDRVWNFHIWQGRPGLWKSLLPRREALEIAAALSDYFIELCYVCDFDANLSESQADANWFALELDVIRRSLDDARAQLRAAEATAHATRLQLEVFQQALAEARAEKEALGAALAAVQTDQNALREVLAVIRGEKQYLGDALAATQAERDALRNALAATQAERDALRNALAATQTERAALQRRLDPLDDLGPTALGLARAVQETARRHPRAAALLRQIARRGWGPFRGHTLSRSETLRLTDTNPGLPDLTVP